MPPIGETGSHSRRRPPLLQMGPVRRFGVTQQRHHSAYDIQLWWRLGGSGLEFAITRQRRIKKSSQRSSAVLDLFAHGSILVIVRRSQRARLTICMVGAYPPGPCAPASMQPFRSGWTMRAREHGGWLELLRVRRSARCQGAQSAP